MDGPSEGTKGGPGSPEPKRDTSLLLGFWHELRERRAFRAAATYAFVVWALIQTTDVLSPILGLPDRVLAGLFMLALIGFPLVLLLAWTIQWGPQGPRLDLPRAWGGQRNYLPLYLLMTCLLTAVLSALIYRSYTQITIEPFDVAEMHAPAQAGTGLVPANSIAVLRFSHLGGSEKNTYFSDGLSEELLNLLTRLQELKVVSRNSSWAIPENMPLEAIRERLHVAYVLEGSVRRGEDTVRVIAQLVSTSDGYQLWSETFDRKLEDVFSVQEEVATRITNALEILLSEKSRRYLEHDRHDNPEAYDAYLQGAEKLRLPADPAVLAEAQAFFTKARDIDPGFSQAWAGLCKSSLEIYQFSKATEDFQRAETSCHRTLTLDESSPGIFEALGDLYTASGQYTRALQSYESALVLAPRSAEALMGMGLALQFEGQVDEAERYLKGSVETDPGYWKTYNVLGTFYFKQGRYGEAIRNYRLVTALAPDYPIGHNNLGAAYMLNGQYKQAAEEFGNSLALGADQYSYSNLGSAEFLLRNFSKAADMYRQAVAQAPDDYLYWGHLGDALRFDAGQRDEADEAYAKALELARQQRQINPADPGLLAASALYHARLGQAEAAAGAIEQLDGMALDVYTYYDLSLAYIALSDEASALAALRKAIEGGYSRKLIAQDPGFDPLQGKSEFLTLLDMSTAEKD